MSIYFLNNLRFNTIYINKCILYLNGKKNYYNTEAIG